MTAEHRGTARPPIDLKVQILYHGRRFFAARGRSISDQGMYLDVRNLTLPVGTRVGLEMECLGRDWRLEAVVVHRSPAGVGVMFSQTQPELELGLMQSAAMPPLLPPPGRTASSGPVRLTRN